VEAKVRHAGPLARTPEDRPAPEGAVVDLFARGWSGRLADCSRTRGRLRGANHWLAITHGRDRRAARATEADPNETIQRVLDTASESDVKKRIRDLDLDGIFAGVYRATNKEKRIAVDWVLQMGLAKGPSTKLALQHLRDFLGFAVGCSYDKPDDIVAEDPLVEAYLRTQSHPETGDVLTVETKNGENAATHLKALLVAHPELAWDPDAVQAAVLASIRQHGDHELDDSHPPWLMDWGPAFGASPLLRLATLRKLGDLPDKIDAWEKGVHDEAREHFERTKDVKPSSRVEPPPKRKT
jgi:DNA-binding Lrp family transcriptional regulator